MKVRHHLVPGIELGDRDTGVRVVRTSPDPLRTDTPRGLSFMSQGQSVFSTQRKQVGWKDMPSLSLFLGWSPKKSQKPRVAY